jgi:hypothetical protein
VQLPKWVPVLLALGTWAVYVGDRLLDARAAFRSGNLNPMRERHFFHWRHRGVMIPVACCAAVLAAAMVVSLMPPAIRERNSVLAFAALAYFSGVHLPRPRTKRTAPLCSKELLVGVLFTAGCAFPVFARIPTPVNSAVQLLPLPILAAFFAVLAWLNCSAIERWESGKANNSSAAFAIAAIGLLASISLLFHQPRTSALFFAGSLSAISLALLDRGRSRFTPLALRCAADFVLLTPILCFAR